MRLGNARERKLLLFLSATDFHARSWQKGELSAATHFTGDAEGREQFAAFLQTHRVPALLLTDLVEEEFRHETIPHLGSHERSALIRRKLDQYYRGTPFRKAATIPRREHGRHEDELLFSALTNPALILPWLDIMQAQGAVLAGIYSVPDVSAQLVKDSSPDRLLLLSWEKHAGLRQNYFEAGVLRFSRLTPMNGHASFGMTAGTEVARTLQYLNNLSPAPTKSALNVDIICHADDWQELEARLDTASSLCCRHLDIQELGPPAEARAAYSSSDATPLFLHQLAGRTPRSSYAAPAHTRLLRLSHIRRILHGLSSVAATASLLWAAASLLSSMELKKETASIKAQAMQFEKQARQAAPAFSDAPAPAADMKAAVLLAREMNMHSPAPQKILKGLSETLDSFPNIRLNKLSWKPGISTAGSLHETSGAHSTYTIMLDGELTGFGGNYREALEHFEHFMRELIRQGYAATTLSPPFNTSSKGSISTDIIEERDRPAKFSLELTTGVSA